MNLEQRVTLIDVDGKETIPGTIAGIGHMFNQGVTRPIYIVRLDNGFYDPTGKTYVSTLVVDRSALRPIE